MKKLTPNLIVDDVEDGLSFWVDRLGFEKTLEVPHEGRVGFVILKRGSRAQRTRRPAWRGCNGERLPSGKSWST